MSDVPKLHCVLYTDGGCRPNPGNMGFGVHGYIYEDNEPKKGYGLLNHLITKDGYVLKNKQNQELYKQVDVKEYLDFTGSSSIKGSNNLAELEAMICALEGLNKSGKNVIFETIKVNTDSEYLRKGVTEWLPLWQKRDWKRSDNTPVPNADVWKKLLSLLGSFKSKGTEFTINWVEGHSDDFGNNKADWLATLGVNYSINNIIKNDHIFSPNTGYWKKSVEKHPFIFYKQMMFNSIKEYSIEGKYYFSKYSKTDHYGKKTNASCFSIVILNKPDYVLELIRNKHFKNTTDTNIVLCTRLDKVYESDTYNHLVDYGEYSLLENNRSMDLNFLDDKPISVEISPPGKVFRAIEDLSYLEDILYSFLDEPTKNPTMLTSINITDQFYDKIVKLNKKNTVETLEVKNELSKITDMNIPVNVMSNGKEVSISVPLILGMDLPNRNSLKKLETDNPNIYIVTWKESEKCFKYACIMTTNDATGIWSNMYANSVIIR